MTLADPAPPDGPCPACRPFATYRSLLHAKGQRPFGVCHTLFVTGWWLAGEILAIFLLLSAVTLRAARIGLIKEGAVWGLVALYGTVATLLITGATSRPAPRGSDVTIVAVSAGEPVEVDGVVDYAGDITDEPDVASSEVLDVTLRNSGEVAAALTEVTLEIVDVHELQDCIEVGGPAVITANYDIGIPNPLPQVPFSVTRGVRFEVLPSRVERLTFKVGPEDFVEGESPSLYLVRLRFDGAGVSKLMSATVAIVGMKVGGEHSLEDVFFKLPPPRPNSNFEQRADLETCMANNRSAVDGFAERAEERSSAFERLLTAAHEV